jgi:hypothetical protein
MPAPRFVVALRDIGLPCVSFLAASVTQAASLWPDAAFGVLGYRPETVAVFGAGASWYLKRPPPTDPGLSIRIDGQVAHWRGLGTPTDNHYLWDFSGTPMLRWTFAQPQSPRLFVEAGVGIHFLSRTWLNTDRQFGISFQFGSIGGVGVVFGDKNQYDLTLFVEHVSNANINPANWGITYPAIAFRMALP